MSDARTFVIVGGGLAGAKAAETLRGEGFDGRLVVVCEEDRLPYERPPLSKGYLAGTSGVADAQVHDEDFYARHGIELRLGTPAAALDPAARRLSLAGGDELAYDRLLLATGATPRRLPIAGAQDALVLRSVADADALRRAIRSGGHLVVLGAGWVGCEAAATARGLGADVTLIEQAPVPLARVLGPELGAFFAALHRDRGVNLLSGTSVSAIEAGGRAIRLPDGRTLACDAVLMGVGVTPATRLAEAAGLAVDDGILVDACLRTSAPDVFAAGDVASIAHPRYGRRVRVEHWATARAQGIAAARSMLGHETPYDELPAFFSDQYDLGLEYVGLHRASDRLVVHGSLEEARFQAFWTAADGTVSAGMHVNEWDAIASIRAVVEARGTLQAA